jgi:hypothetical protein
MTEETVANAKQGLVAAGASLVWRRRSILWWVFAVNAVLGAMGTLPAALQLNRALHHTLAGEQLVSGFDLGMFYELQRLPEVNLFRFTTSSYVFAFLFALFMLFVSGGIFEVYCQDRRLDTGDFFTASGAFLWRFVRLTLFSLVPFALIREAYFHVEKASDYLGDKVPADQVGFGIWLVGMIIIVLLALFVRLWFDIAKVRAVAEKERRMWPNMWMACVITVRQLRTLLWMYLCISLVAWISLLVAFLIWTKIPPTAIWATFVLLELVMLVQLGARLWQTASATVWYKRHAEMVSADSVHYTTPHPQEVIKAQPEPQPQLSLYPETELPPADA